MDNATTNKQNRKLAAILFADIQGYTSLMQKDETKATVLLRRFQKELTDYVEEHNGRVVNFYGDGALCLFDNPLESVRCAIDLQSAYRTEPTVPVRVGIHMGTVVTEAGKVYGDSVNLASRIESMGVPGAILVSRKVRDELKNQPDLLMPSLGKFEFKNVEEPLEIFAIANDGFAVPERKLMQGKLKNKTFSGAAKWAIAVAGLVVVITLASNFFFGKSAKAESETVTITNDRGESTTRLVPTVDFTKRLIIFPFENNTGNTNLEWLKVGGSYLLDKDIEQDVRLYCTQALSMKYQYESYNHQYLGKIPFATQVKIAQDYYSDYFITTDLENDAVGLKANVKAFSTDTGKEFYRKEIIGEDIFSIVDELSADLSNQLYPAETGQSFSKIDLPVSNLISQDADVVKKFIEANIMIVENVSNLDKAINLLEETLVQDPQCAECYSRLAALIIGKGQTNKAKEYIAKANELATVLPERQQLNMQFFEYQIQNRVDKMTALLENWRRLYPNDLTPYDHLISIYERSMQNDKAKKVGIDAVAKGHKGSMLTTLSRLYTKSEDYDQAEKYLEEYALLYPHKAKERGQLGEIYISKGELDKAKTLYQELQILDPKDTDILNKIGDLEERLGNFDKAFGIYNEILAKANQIQDSISVYEAIADLYVRQGQYTRAFEYIGKSEMLLEKLIPIPYVRQRILFGNIQKWIYGGKKEEYNRRFEEVVSMFPDQKETFECIGNFLFDMYSEDLEAINEATEECVTIISQNSGVGFSHLMNGTKARLEGDYGSAAKEYQMYMDTSGTTARQLGSELSEIYRKSDQIERAEELINKLLSVDPYEPTFLVERAKIAHHNEDHEGMRSYLAKAMAIWKDADPIGRDFQRAKKFEAEVAQLE